MAIETFEDWMQEIVSFDRETTADLKQITEIMEENSSKHQRLNNLSANFITAPIAPASSFQYLSSNSMYQCPFVATGANAVQPVNFCHNENIPPCTNNSISTNCIFCPALTENDKLLLNKHHGCRKCRKFYVAHQMKDCPNNFPDRATYIPLTEELAFKMMRKSVVASTYSAPTIVHQHGIPTFTELVSQPCLAPTSFQIPIQTTAPLC
jgi:hypothetical protein